MAPGAEQLPEDPREMLGLGPDDLWPSPNELMERMQERYGPQEPVNLREGDRLELVEDSEVLYGIAYSAPASGGGLGRLPAGTVFVVDYEPVEEAVGFSCIPEDYAGVEQMLIPEHEREFPRYGGYSVNFLKRDVGRALRVLQPQDDS